MKTLLISLLLTTAACGQVPWLELNSMKDTYTRNFLAGVPVWSQVSDTWIVSTTALNVDTVYPFVMESVTPDITILGGVKTAGHKNAHGVAYKFFDPGLWQLIADAGVAATGHTGSGVVVLDSETLLREFHRGNEELDYEALAISMAPLNNDIQWWFAFPHVRGGDSVWPGRKAETLRLTEAVRDAVPNAMFITTYTAKPDLDLSRGREQMIATVGAERMIEMFYPHPDGYYHHPNGKLIRYTSPAETLDLIPTSLNPHTVIVYPGWRNWELTGRMFRNERARR